MHVNQFDAEREDIGTGTSESGRWNKNCWSTCGRNVGLGTVTTIGLASAFARIVPGPVEEGGRNETGDQ